MTSLKKPPQSHWLKMFFLNKQTIKNSPLFLFIIFCCSISVNSLISQSGNPLLEFLKIVSGILGFILIPGIYIAVILDREETSNFAFALIFGFLLQLIAIYSILWIFSLVGNLYINFYFWLEGITFVYTSALTIYALRKKSKIFYKPLIKIDRVLLICVSLCLSVSLALGINAVLNSDGGVYYDLARNVLNNNVFSSHVIQAPNTWAEAQYSTGMIDHFFGYAALVDFFAIGTVSLTVAKLMLVFAGTLALFPVYLISKSLFGIRIAQISAFLTALSPILLYHLSLIGGPDIISLLFTLTSISLLILCIKEKRWQYSLFAIIATAVFVAWYAWQLNGYILILCLPAFLVLYYTINNKLSKFGLFSLLILVVLFFMDFFIVGHITLRYIGFPLPVASAIALLIFYKIRPRCFSNALIVILGISLVLVFFAFYIPRITLAPFVNFDTYNFPTAQVQVNANSAQLFGTLSNALDLGRILNFGNWYLFGKSFSWSGLANSLGFLVLFSALFSLVKINKLREIVLIAVFPVTHMLLWVLISPEQVVQPRYLLSVAPFFIILMSITLGSIISVLSSIGTKYLVFSKNYDRFNGKLRKFDFTKVLALILILVTLLAWQPVYGNLSQNIAYWNDYPAIYNWENTVNWINQNTKSNDVLATVYADYFVWLTNRPTVFLWHANANLNMTGLIEIIRESKVNYLIVDQPFNEQFVELKSLYTNPEAFLGVTVVFLDKSSNNNVIVYNVTNISHGVYSKSTFSFNGTNVTNWKPCTYYSSGVIQSSNNSVDCNLTVLDTPWPAASCSFLPSRSFDISNYSSLAFDVWVPNGTNRILTEILSGDENQNYFSYVVNDVPGDQWNHVTFFLEKPFTLIGQPSLFNVTGFNFIASGLPVNSTNLLRIKNLEFFNDSYILK